jgi:hypothetical protein
MKQETLGRPASDWRTKKRNPVDLDMRPTPASVLQKLQRSIPAILDVLSHRWSADNEAMQVLAQLDDRSLYELKVMRSAYMRVASNFRLKT